MENIENKEFEFSFAAIFKIFKEIRKNAGLIQSLSQQALSQKVTRFLLDNNNIKFVAETEK